MKKLTLLIIILAAMTVQKSFAEGVLNSDITIKTSAVGSEFTGSYKTSCENLLYILLAAINEQNYLIEEIQFKTGSVLFKAATKEFIAHVSAQDGYNSFIKIMPADNSSDFSPLIIQRLHSYIENNNAVKYKKVL